MKEIDIFILGYKDSKKIDLDSIRFIGYTSIVEPDDLGIIYNKYLKYDFIMIKNLKPIMEYFQVYFPKKILTSKIKNAINDLITFRERYSISDEEFLDIINKKLSKIPI